LVEKNFAQFYPTLTNNVVFRYFKAIAFFLNLRFNTIAAFEFIALHFLRCPHPAASSRPT
jgi:hypothetical protein